MMRLFAGDAELSIAIDTWKSAQMEGCLRISMIRGGELGEKTETAAVINHGPCSAKAEPNLARE
jgi:hypothetical protein